MFPEKWKSAEWHRPTECYVHEDGEDIRIGNSLIERVLSREGGYLQTKAITNKRTGRTWRTDTRAEARLSFGASSWRRDVITWRYAPRLAAVVRSFRRHGFPTRISSTRP